MPAFPSSNHSSSNATETPTVPAFDPFDASLVAFQSLPHNQYGHGNAASYYHDSAFSDGGSNSLSPFSVPAPLANPHVSALPIPHSGLPIQPTFDPSHGNVFAPLASETAFTDTHTFYSSEAPSWPSLQPYPNNFAGDGLLLGGSHSSNNTSFTDFFYASNEEFGNASLNGDLPPTEFSPDQHLARSDVQSTIQSLVKKPDYFMNVHGYQAIADAVSDTFHLIPRLTEHSIQAFFQRENAKLVSDLGNLNLLNGHNSDYSGLENSTASSQTTTMSKRTASTAGLMATDKPKKRIRGKVDPETGDLSTASNAIPYTTYKSREFVDPDTGKPSKAKNAIRRYVYDYAKKS